MGGKDDGVKVFSAAKYGRVNVFIVVQERRASRSPSWRRSAAKDGKVTLTRAVKTKQVFFSKPKKHV